MSDSPYNQPTPAGWYPDPSGAPGQRYFDGTNWAASPPPPPKKKSKAKIVLGVLGALLALLIIIGIASGGEDEKSPTASESSTSSSAPTQDSDVAPAGSAVRDGKFEFQVVSVERAKTVSDPTNNPYMTTQAQGEFVVVTLSVTNVGDKPQNYFGDNQKVIDANGRQYSANSEAGLWMNPDQSVMGEINPGNSIQVKAAFDVPVGVVPTTLEVHDSAFSGGVKVRLA